MDALTERMDTMKQMLAALKDARRYFQNRPGNEESGLDAMLGQAIARAEGQAELPEPMFVQIAVCQGMSEYHAAALYALDADGAVWILRPRTTPPWQRISMRRSPDELPFM